MRRQRPTMNGNLCRLWPIVLIALLGLCCCGAVGCATNGGPAEKGLEVHVMSFNIRYGTAGDGENHWDKRREIVCDLIAGQGCDVVGLQEALRFQIDQIRGAVPG